MLSCPGTESDFGTNCRPFHEIDGEPFHGCLYEELKFEFRIGRASFSKTHDPKSDLGIRLLDVPKSKANRGRQIVSELPIQFRSENHGRFIAVTFTGVILAVCDTLESLNKEIVKKNVKENYYIERIGYSGIAQI